MLSPAFKTEAKEINARAHDYDHDGGEDPDFSGFHKIEQLLYRDQTLTGAQPLAAGLQAGFSDKPLALVPCYPILSTLTAVSSLCCLDNNYVVLLARLICRGHAKAPTAPMLTGCHS